MTNINFKLFIEVKMSTTLYSNIFVLNMPQSTERWERVSKRLDEVDVDYERFEAIYGLNTLITNQDTNKTFTGHYLQEGRIKT